MVQAQVHIPPELLPVVQITVPLLIGLFIAVWFQSHSLSLTNKRIDDVLAELRLMRAEISKQGERLARLEERIPPLIHR